MEAGQGIFVGMATRYGMWGSEFEPRWRQEIFLSPHSSRPALVPIEPPVQCVPENFLGGKSARAWLWYPLPIRGRG